MSRIGFLGPRATFAEQALHTLPEAADAELIPCAGSPAVLAALRAGTIDAGFVPIENTVEGAVPAVLDGLVDDPPLVIVREAVLRGQRLPHRGLGDVAEAVEVEPVVGVPVLDRAGLDAGEVEAAHGTSSASAASGSVRSACSANVARGPRKPMRRRAPAVSAG